VFEGFKDLGSTSIIHQLFSLVVIVEKVTYNLVILEYQNSLNIGHNANPTFYLMNNQFNNFEDTKGFILNTPKDMKLDFFLLTFGICCVFLKLKPLLPFLELIGILLPFHFFFFCFYIAFLKVFLDGPQSMTFLLLALSQSLDFCSKYFPYPLTLTLSSSFLGKVSHYP
jgi:hypothetical protein